MNKEQQAINEWFDSEEGRSCANLTTLPRDNPQYLRNRLERAFLAGMQAGMGIARDRIAAMVTRVLEQRP